RAKTVPIPFRHALFSRARHRTQLQFDQTRPVLRMTQDAGPAKHRGLPDHRNIAELLILVPEFTALQLSMEAAAFHASREMAPVGSHQRTRHRCGTWGGHESSDR